MSGYQTSCDEDCITSVNSLLQTIARNMAPTYMFQDQLSISKTGMVTILPVLFTGYTTSQMYDMAIAQFDSIPK